MGGDDSWFTSLWRKSRKTISVEAEKPTIGILAFEISGLMTKVVNLWQSLSDMQMVRLREEIGNSFGVRKLVSDDDDYLMDLALAEIIENLLYLAKSVARLGKKCVDPVYHQLEHVFDDVAGVEVNWCGWEYRLKKMEKKVKKMERFVAVTAQMYQELEVLAELEQSLRRMRANTDITRMKLFEFQKKVMWQRQEVKNLRETSLWVRTHDYTVRLLLRSLFTILFRIKHVFNISQSPCNGDTRSSECTNESCIVRSHSLSARMLTSVHPSENCLFGINSRPIGRSCSTLGISTDKLSSKKKHNIIRQGSSIISSKSKTRQSSHIGSFGGCIPGTSESPFMETCMQTNNALTNDKCRTKNKNLEPFYISKRKLLNASSSTLGGAGLALHYANLVVLIEKLASAPHLIGLDARDDLYNMLPSSLRSILRAKLKLFARNSSSCIYDETLAREWSSALARIVEWLAPLAHNMIRWHSVRNFEKQHLVLDSNMLLVQTLYFANREDTEAAIVELLMGLNYISRFGGEINDKSYLKSAGGRVCDDYFLKGDNIIYCS